MIERRLGLKTDTGHARRWHDKLFGFILGLLLIFLLNWILGCGHIEVVKLREPLNCADPYFKDDVRCGKAFYRVPDQNFELDTPVTVDFENIEFD